MQEIIDRLKQVTTPSLTMVLMRDHGLYNTSIRDVRPSNPAACRFAGPAVTLRYVPLREDKMAEQYLSHPDNPIQRIIEETAPGSVFVLDANQRNDVGMLGGNLVMRMYKRGIAAAVTDGGMRDLPELSEIDLPVFATASAPPPSFAALMMVDHDCVVSCGGVPVYPGDIVVGDDEGVVAVPAGIADAVAEAGAIVDKLDGYAHRRLSRGEALPGLYPPGDKVKAEFQAWLDAGEPDEALT